MFEDPSGHFSITKWVTDKVSDVVETVTEVGTKIKDKVVETVYAGAKTAAARILNRT